MRTAFHRSRLARQIGLFVFPSSNFVGTGGAASLWIGSARPIFSPCSSCRGHLMPVSANRYFASKHNANSIGGNKPHENPESALQSAPPQPQPILLQKEIKNLPSEAERRRSNFSKSVSTTMDNLQSAVFTAGQRLNDLTGYSGIESLKKSIEEQEAHVKACREEVKSAKEAYQAAINRRSASQREVNELLQRKHAWSPSDLERFTELYRSDHANEQAETAAQERLARAEQLAEEAQSQLARSILTRYHEEQIWSDKIRRASTWGTWGLMGFNVLLFIIVQLGLEPWKRRRLVGGFEDKVRKVIQEENTRNELSRLEPRTAHVAGTDAEPEIIFPQAAAVEKATETIEIQPETPIPASASNIVVHEEDIFAEQTSKETDATTENVATELQDQINWLPVNFRGLWSYDPIMVRRIDITAVALESAAAGAIITGLILFLINHHR